MSILFIIMPPNSELRNQQIGFPHLHFTKTDSTNTVAKKIADRGAPHGTTVTADEQTKGRGRQGRQWVMPPQAGLLCSIVIRKQPVILPIRAGVACATTIHKFAVNRVVSIKWPNDILLGGRKVAGILTEGQPQANWAVIGIGINVATEQHQFPPEIQRISTSLGLKKQDIPDIYEELITQITYWLQQPPQIVQEGWNQHDALAGKDVRRGNIAGKGRGITPNGELVIERRDGVQEYVGWGEVEQQQ